MNADNVRRFTGGPKRSFEVRRRNEPEDDFEQQSSTRIGYQPFQRTPVADYPHSITSNASADSGSTPTPSTPSLRTFAPPAYFLPKKRWYFITTLRILLLSLTYFLAQVDKFLISYYSKPITASLHLAPSQYAQILSYWTGVVYIPASILIAWFADYQTCRVKLLAFLAGFWSLCVVCQGLAQNHRHMLLARMGMGIGQAGSEALSVSLISDLAAWPEVFLGESVLYVAIYLGDAVAGRIALAFETTGIPKWDSAMKCTGMIGIVLASLIMAGVAEPVRQTGLVEVLEMSEEAKDLKRERKSRGFKGSCKRIWIEMSSICRYMIKLQSLWILVLSSAIRHSAANVVGYYMPGYINNIYPSQPSLRETYGLILGATSSLSVLLGGLIACLLWRYTKTWKYHSLPLWIAAVGGLICSVCLICAVFSHTSRSEPTALRVLYSTLTFAIFASETWLGCLSTIITGLLPPDYKTFGFAVCGAMQWMIYSPAPEIIRFSLTNVDPESPRYTRIIQVCLGTIPPVCYFWAGVGFIFAGWGLRRDLEDRDTSSRKSDTRRQLYFVGVFIFFATVVLVLVVLDVRLG
ncbi:MFS general substrate transporter [Lindgomyces ingoldianus]|uniref:MFS general substrate transporter n=1 Tax=Lindgomyces ingoldianus TaxID=673940 RepID=A0ACB6QH92_9PLEO|nr:MFS general substrate transporter [Lindgomyces ingoldianus]KAF2466353.1 MFS general substrate transporter [Lindgomyces ingoldianus]